MYKHTLTILIAAVCIAAATPAILAEDESTGAAGDPRPATLEERVKRFGGAKAACDGPVAIIRKSIIKPEGSIEGYKAAVDAHVRWHRKIGSDKNTPVTLMVFKPWQAEFDTDHVYSLHVNPPGPTFEGGSMEPEGYQQFVAMYQENSEIVVEELVCLKGLAEALNLATSG